MRKGKLEHLVTTGMEEKCSRGKNSVERCWMDFNKEVAQRGKSNTDRSSESDKGYRCIGHDGLH